MDTLRIADLSKSQILALRRVGFWWSPDEPDLPHPRDYIDPSWDPAERDRVIDYLEQSYHLEYMYAGYSWCRLGCPHSPDIGTQDRTDGTWLFPEGLVHYLRHHALRPPRDFIEHLRKMNFTVPKLPGLIINKNKETK